MKVDITTQELATILAALRCWQQTLEAHGVSAVDGEGFFEVEKPLNPYDIDDLCERLNCSPTKREHRATKYKKALYALNRAARGK